MIATIACPGCNVSLKRPVDLPSGKRIQCPHCGTAFVPAGETEAGLGVTSAYQPPSAAPAVSRPSRPASPAKKARPEKGSSAVVLLAVIALLVVLALVGGAVAVLAFFGPDWSSKNKPAVAGGPMPQMPDMGNQRPPMPGGPGGPFPGVGNPGAPGPIGPGMNPQNPMQPGAPGAVGPAPGVNNPGAANPGGPMQPLQPRQQPLQVGQAAPEIDGKDLDGKPMKLSAFRGKVVVLDFWGDWCPFCKAAYTYQRDLVQRMQGRSFVLVGVNCDQTIEQARLVVKNQRITWRSWWDGPQDMSGAIYKRWGVQAVPSVFVLDTKGVIRQHYEGAPPEGALENLVESLLPASERGRPRWFAPATRLTKLGPEADVGAYRMRLPREMTAHKPPPEDGQTIFLWKHSTLFNGATQLQVTLRPAAEDKPEDAIEKRLASVPCLRQGWTCSAVQRGVVQGLIFYRVNWSGIERGDKRPVAGFVYAAVDGDTLIEIAGRTTEANHSELLLADAAALTFRKPPK
jgi:peroxiredoxin